MESLFGPIIDVFEITGRGCIVAIENERIAPDVKLHIGDVVVLKSASQAPIKTVVRGLDFGRGTSNFVGVLVGPEVLKSMILAHTELWKEIS